MTTATPSQPRTTSTTRYPSNGGRLVTADGRALPLARRRARAPTPRGGVARVVLEQRFANPHAEPLAVTYSLPLPADGAVSGFAFRIGDRRVVGEVDRAQAARERFEQALVEGAARRCSSRSGRACSRRRSATSRRARRWSPRSPSTSGCAGSTRARGSGASRRWSRRATWARRAACPTPTRVDAGRRRRAAAGARSTLARPSATRSPPGARPESPSHALDVARRRRGRRRLRDEGDAARGSIATWWCAGRWRRRKVGLSLDVGRPAAAAPHAERGVRPAHARAAASADAARAGRARSHRAARHQRLDGGRAARPGAARGRRR